MSQPSETVVPRQLVHALSPEAKAFRVTRLTGGVSAEAFAVELTHSDDSVETVVVRHRPASPDRLSMTQEYAVQSAVHEAGLPVPRPRLLWSAETMVMDFVEGTSALPTHGPEMMADALARIHAQSIAGFENLPAREEPTSVLERTLADAGLSVPLIEFGVIDPSLLHGDFWAGNLLWREGELAAILDWEDAAIGDPLSDVASARVELEVASGPSAAEAFTTRYDDVTHRASEHVGNQRESAGLDWKRLTLWDVYVSTTALEAMDSWGLPAEVLNHRRTATTTFLNRAIETLRRMPHARM